MENKQQVVIGVAALKTELTTTLLRKSELISQGKYVDELHRAKARAKQELLKDMVAAIAEIPAEDFPPPARHSTDVVQKTILIIEDKLAENTYLQHRYPEAGQTLTAEMWVMKDLRDQIQKLLDAAAPAASDRCASPPRFLISKEGPWYVATDTVGGKYLRYFECRACAAAYCDRLNAGSPE